MGRRGGAKPERPGKANSCLVAAIGSDGVSGGVSRVGPCLGGVMWGGEGSLGRRSAPVRPAGVEVVC